MPTRIKQLNCRVTVRTGRRESALHQSGHAPKPSMNYAMPMTQPNAATSPEPSQMATEGRNQQGEGTWETEKPPVTAGSADPQAVADRVYELMKREIAIDRERGGQKRKG